MDRTFQPGRIGLVAAWQSGLVTEIVNAGQAQGLGVRVGSWMTSIDEKPYTEKLLDAKIDGGVPYTIGFVQVWHMDSIFALGSKGCEYKFEGKAMLLDTSQWTSVTDAVEALSNKTLVVDAGVCVVWSNSQQTYFLICRGDKEIEALTQLGMHAELKKRNLKAARIESESARFKVATIRGGQPEEEPASMCNRDASAVGRVGRFAKVTSLHVMSFVTATRTKVVSAVGTAGAVLGGVAGGAVGTVAGAVTGGAAGAAAGAAVGVVPAIFTFGASIPICAAAGLCAGATTGGVVGAVGGVGVGGTTGAAGGAAVGYVGYTYQDEIQDKAREIQDKADIVVTKAQTYSDCFKAKLHGSLARVTNSVKSIVGRGTPDTLRDARS